MPIVHRGKSSYVDGREVENHGEHGALVAAARKRVAGPTGRATVGLAPTIGVQVFYNEREAEWYREKLDAGPAKVRAIRAAVEHGADDEELAAVAARSAAAHAKALGRWARAFQIDRDSRDRDGHWHTPGSWYVAYHGGGTEMVSDEDFAVRFRQPTEAEVVEFEAESAAAEEEARSAAVERAERAAAGQPVFDDPRLVAAEEELASLRAELAEKNAELARVEEERAAAAAQNNKGDEPAAEEG